MNSNIIKDFRKVAVSYEIDTFILVLPSVKDKLRFIKNRAEFVDENGIRARIFHSSQGVISIDGCGRVPHKTRRKEESGQLEVVVLSPFFLGEGQEVRTLTNDCVARKIGYVVDEQESFKF
jgi:hypothetical protein